MYTCISSSIYIYVTSTVCSNRLTAIPKIRVPLNIFIPIILSQMWTTSPNQSDLKMSIQILHCTALHVTQNAVSQAVSTISEKLEFNYRLSKLAQMSLVKFANAQLMRQEMGIWNVPLLQLKYFVSKKQIFGYQIKSEYTFKIYGYATHSILYKTFVINTTYKTTNWEQNMTSC